MPLPINLLIERLSRKDRRDLLALCKPVSLRLSDVLCEPGTPMRHIYFPTSGRISLISRSAGQAGVEVGMVGREGMLGAHLLLGVEEPPWCGLVLGMGVASRASAVDFRQMLKQSATLRRILGRYLYVLLAQLAIASACQRYHPIGPRLARWLLMSQDRARKDVFYVTHETLAAMLGVRRVGVTMAASILQRQGLIAYHRGEMTVLDRAGLHDLACACYDFDRAAYADLLI